MTAKSATAEELQANVNDAISDAEEMLAEAANASGDKAAELRARALKKLKLLRERMEDARVAALKQGRAAAHATDDYVHDHPWRSIVAAASIGVVVGLLIARR